ncbi:MAG TPA: WD40 repeat domain-containing protein, partial [Acidobacteriaceae bacterium]|nr:WD40 repeat domain-containing protein [Acidobacteriaceae bacterium]
NHLNDYTTVVAPRLLNAESQVLAIACGGGVTGTNEAYQRVLIDRGGVKIDVIYQVFEATTAHARSDENDEPLRDPFGRKTRLIAGLVFFRLTGVPPISQSTLVQGQNQALVVFPEFWSAVEKKWEIRRSDPVPVFPASGLDALTLKHQPAYHSKSAFLTNLPEERTPITGEASSYEFVREFEVRSHDDPDDYPVGIALSNHSPLIAVRSARQNIYIWNLSGQLLASISGGEHHALPSTIRFDLLRGNRLLTVVSDTLKNKVLLTSLYDRNRYKTEIIARSTDKIRALCLAPDNTVYCATGTNLFKLALDEDLLTSITRNFSSDYSIGPLCPHIGVTQMLPTGFRSTPILLGNESGDIGLLHASKGLFTRTRVHKRRVSALGMHRRSGIMASAGQDRLLTLWDYESIDPLGQIQYPHGVVTAIAVTSSNALSAEKVLAGTDTGELLAVCLSERRRGWEMSSLSTLISSQTQTTAIALNENGSYFARGNADGTVRLWRKLHVP